MLKPHWTKQQEQANWGLLAVFSCMFLWLVLPLIAWLFVTFFTALVVNNKGHSNVIAMFVSFSLAFLISSRYVGFLWGGADDMPSYFMGYENYYGLSSIISSSLLYAKHADLLFGFYSWLVAKITNHHLFIYYFVTVLISYLLVWNFYKITKVPYPLLCFLLAVLFFKHFQGQWHLIRSWMALPVLLTGLWISCDKPKKGSLIFFIGGLIHFSTFFVLLPLWIFKKWLSRHLTAFHWFALLVICVAGVSVLLLSVQLLAKFSGYYFISKILTRLSVEPDFSKVSFLLFFLLINLLVYPAYRITQNKEFIRFFNVSSVIIILSTIAVFIKGDELYRILLPLFLLYSPLIIFSISYIKPRIVGVLLLLGVGMFNFTSISYVISLNQSKFFYKSSPMVEPILYNGFQSLKLFIPYLEQDITYYDGYRNK